MNFYVKFIEGPRQVWEGPGLAAHMAELLAQANHPRHRVVAEPERADAIILFESNLFKPEPYLNSLERESTLRQWPEKCFSVNYEPDALGLLPGVYTGLPQRRFDPRRHRASGYVLPSNGEIEAAVRTASGFEPVHLASFRGALSHPMRRALVEKKGEWASLGPITNVARWFDHTEEEKRTYREEILASKFVLCPRGLSPASIRLYEVMQMGRVPIILSDEWVPPAGPPWGRFSVRVPEARLADIPQILAERAGEWREMGQRARAAWEEWFSPGKNMLTVAEAIEDLLQQRPLGHSEAAILARWHTWRGRSTFGWTIPQRVANRAHKWVRRKLGGSGEKQVSQPSRAGETLV